jgi:alkylation response protein AidB-like acyl-CoA dehydrogenase
MTYGRPGERRPGSGEKSMDLNFTSEDIAFRDQVRQWFEANTPKTELKTMEERKAWQRQLFQAGFVGMGWSHEYGGRAARPLQQAIVADEMARANAPMPANPLGLSIVGPTLIVHGNEWQKQRYVQKILTAEEIWCQLFSEPNAGSDLASLQTRAEDKGDHWEINGQKVWTSAGSVADWGILLARTDQQAPKHQGISFFLLNMHDPGVQVRPLKQITGGSEFSEVFFTNARVEKENLVGKLNQGWHIAQTTLGYERGTGTLERVTLYLMSLRRIMVVTQALQKNGHPAFDDPLVRQKLGRLYVELEVMRYSGLRVLSQLEKGRRPGPESSIAKLYYSEFGKRMYEEIMEILGPYGEVVEGLPPELGEDRTSVGYARYGNWGIDFLQSRGPTIYAGTSEIQKNIIGERVLGLPKEVRMDRLQAKGE